MAVPFTLAGQSTFQTEFCPFSGRRRRELGNGENVKVIEGKIIQNEIEMKDMSELSPIDCKILSHNQCNSRKPEDRFSQKPLQPVT